ncbi:MAG TPA: hypothetical protein PKW42_07015, partial [bacterium]|nr:hypothetical protein [bacterium]
APAQTRTTPKSVAGANSLAIWRAGDTAQWGRKGREIKTCKTIDRNRKRLKNNSDVHRSA